jgi:hypothetical protein
MVALRQRCFGPKSVSILFKTCAFVYPWNYTVPFSISPIIHPSDHISTELSMFLSPIYLPINKRKKRKKKLPATQEQYTSNQPAHHL